MKRVYFNGVLPILVLILFWGCGGEEQNGKSQNPPKGIESQAETFDLSPKHEIGQSYLMVLRDNETVSGQGAEDKEWTMNVSIEREIKVTAESVAPDGRAGFRGTLEKVLVKFSTDEAGDKIYDSDAPATDEMHQIYKDMIGTEYTWATDPTGKVTSLSASKSLLDRMLPDSSYTGADHMREMMNMHRVWPSKKVQEGASWEGSSRLSAQYPMLLASRYTLVEKKDYGSKIKVKGLISPNPEAKSTLEQGMAITYALEGDKSGTYDLDASGLLKSYDVTYNLEGTTTVTSPGMEPMIGPIQILRTEKMSTQSLAAPGD